LKRFSELVRSVAAARVSGNVEVDVTGLAYDSRQVQPGWAFICVAGSKTDGHRFIDEAIEKGAVALVAEAGRERGAVPPTGGALAVVPDTRAAMASLARAFYDDPTSRLCVAGVTGTNGKTTTAIIIDAIFREAGYESGLIGTLEHRIGKERLRPLHTTPEAVDLQGLLAALVAEGATHAAMEVSSHALALHRVDGCQFAAAVFTNLTPEHLDFHHDMGEYLEAKRRLFEDPQYLPQDGARVNAVNVDDDAGREVARSARGRTLTYAVSSDADCRAEDVELRASETRFTAVLPTGKMPVRMELVGLFNVYNALGAMAASAGLGISPEAACSALARMPTVRGRFERVPARTRTVLVDYAHTPDSLGRALETARHIARGRVLVVFGCGGDRDRTKRPVMGEIASRLADVCVVTSDNPRSEEPEAIIEEILGGIPEDRRGRCLVNEDRAAAIRTAIEQSSPDDLVLVAGKGHEDYQIFADRTVHFDDREVAEAALREIGESPSG